MKMFKKIFIALLIASVLVSSFAAFAMAEEPDTETEVEPAPSYPVEEYENLLEYFEELCLFDYDFADEGVDYSASLLTNKEGDRADRVVAGLADGILSLTVKGREENVRKYAYSDLNTYLAWTADSPVDSFVADMEISGSSNPGEEFDVNNLPKIVIVVSDSKLESAVGAAETGTAIASIDFRGGYFTYLKSVEDEGGNAKGVEFVTNFAVSADSWYTVSLTYDVENCALSITVTDSENEKSITVTDGYIPYDTVRDVRIGAHGTDGGTARGTVMSFKSARVFSGVYHRTEAGKQTDIETRLLEMYDAVNDAKATHEDRIAICDIVAKIKNYGFTTESADVQQVLDEIGIGAIAYYNGKLAECLGTLETLTVYAEKRECVDAVLGYAEALADLDLSGETEEARESVVANLAAIETVDGQLAYAKAHTLEFISNVEDARKIDLTVYPDVLDRVEVLSAYDPDLTYEGAEEAHAFYVVLCDTEKAMKDGAELFISEVGKANDETLDINTRVAAFREVESNFFDNETYPGVTEALDIYWDILYQEFTDIIFYAESFIRYVEKADYSPYVLAKQNNLDVAAGYMDICHPEYTGVAEAKLLFVEVQNNIDELVANANKYIAAVNALDKLGMDELLEAIEEAKELQKVGNVGGVPGVIEANIKLDEIIASIELGDRYCIYFINLVNSLDSATSVSEFYKILVAAKKAEKDIVDDYEGIAEACEKLEQAISDYNNKVASVNVEFEQACETAAYTAGAGKGTNYVSVHVIALIKKGFDEE